MSSEVKFQFKKRIKLHFYAWCIIVLKFFIPDIDECSTNMDNCADPPAMCMNTMGSFTCSCPGGFAGDGTMAHPCVGMCQSWALKKTIS